MKVINMPGTNIYSHVQVKQIYRFFKVSQLLHVINTSGLYKDSLLWQWSKETGINYNTLKMDLSHTGTFAAIGLINRVKRNGYFNLNKLTGTVAALYEIYKGFKTEIETSKYPAKHFSDLYKRKLIHDNAVLQAKQEANKIDDKKVKKKYLSLVKHNGKREIGEKDNILISLRTITRLLSPKKNDAGEIKPLSLSTVHRYIEGLHCSNIMQRRRHSRKVGNMHGFLEIRKRLKNKKLDPLYGRLYIDQKGIVRERLLNGYFFN